MKILTEVRFYLVLVSLSLIILILKFMNLQDELIKCQTNNGYVVGGDIEKSELLNKIDSLNSELFVKDIQIGSYEVMWGILEEINKPLADSINNQVE